MLLLELLLALRAILLDYFFSFSDWDSAPLYISFGSHKSYFHRLVRNLASINVSAVKQHKGEEGEDACAV